MTISIDFNNKIAVITGGSSGNGLGILKKFFKAGAFCINIDKNNLSESLLSECNGSYLYIKADVSDANLINILDSSELISVKNIDFLINNAGITIGNAFERYSTLDWDKTLSTNLKSVFLLTQYFVNRGFNFGGSIVNISSLASEQGFPGNVAYVASKGALKQLSKALALDLSDRGLRVNCVGPGYIRTAMTEKSWADPQLKNERSKRMISKRWGEPEDVANACIFLCSDLASYITGQDLYVDGGWLSKGL